MLVQCCICPAHQAYQGLTQGAGRDDVCCVCCVSTGAVTKPHFVDGSQPCCKYGTKSCCCVRKIACPLDDDVDGKCGCCPIFCIPGALCCPKTPPIPESSWGGYAIEAKAPTPGQEYLCCAYPFYAYTICTRRSPRIDAAVSLLLLLLRTMLLSPARTDIPAKTVDALGNECKCASLCLEGYCKCQMLPAHEGVERELFIDHACAPTSPKRTLPKRTQSVQ